MVNEQGVKHCSHWLYMPNQWFIWELIPAIAVATVGSFAKTNSFGVGYGQ